MRRAAIKPFFVALLFAVPAFAQEGGDKTIDLFENQEEMSSSAVSVEGADGSTVESSGVQWGGTTSGITLHYERNGSSILVPAEVEGKDVYFLFDTGATYTTLTGAFARSAGIAPKKSYPTMVGQTANGPRASRVGLMNRLQLGGRAHFGVTFTICDACPSGMYRGKPIVGLLGLNVIGRYRTSFDDAKGVVKMYPTSAYMDRSRDIKPWLQLRYGKSMFKGKVFRFAVNVTNRAPRTIKSLDLKFSCAAGEPVTVTKRVGAKEKVRITESIPTGKCPVGFDGDIVEAKW